MAKINYPTDEWIDNYCEKHDCSIEDADLAWWDKEIDAGRPTPHDLTEEQEKAVKKVCKNAKSVKTIDAYGKERKRERKADETKRMLINNVRILLEGMALNGKVEDVEITNIEKSIDFKIKNDHYTFTLTKHRPPKG